MQPGHKSTKHPQGEAVVAALLTPLLALILFALVSAISYAAPAKKQTETAKTRAAAGNAIDAAAQTPSSAADVDAIGLIICKYAKSIDAADTTMATQVWWDSPEVSFIHPLGHEHGLDQIKANVYTHLMGETFFPTRAYAARHHHPRLRRRRLVRVLLGFQCQIPKRRQAYHYSWPRNPSLPQVPVRLAHHPRSLLRHAHDSTRSRFLSGVVRSAHRAGESRLFNITRVNHRGFSSRSRIWREESDRQVASRSQTGWSIQNHGDRVDYH